MILIFSLLIGLLAKWLYKCGVPEIHARTGGCSGINISIVAVSILISRFSVGCVKK